jgi:hypothetical protein
VLLFELEVKCAQSSAAQCIRLDISVLDGAEKCHLLQLGGACMYKAVTFSAITIKAVQSLSASLRNLQYSKASDLNELFLLLVLPIFQPLLPD